MWYLTLKAFNDVVKDQFLTNCLNYKFRKRKKKTYFCFSIILFIVIYITAHFKIIIIKITNLTFDNISSLHFSPQRKNPNDLLHQLRRNQFEKMSRPKITLS